MIFLISYVNDNKLYLYCNIAGGGGGGAAPYVGESATGCSPFVGTAGGNAPSSSGSAGTLSAGGNT